MQLLTRRMSCFPADSSRVAEVHAQEVSSDIPKGMVGGAGDQLTGITGTLFGFGESGGLAGRVRVSEIAMLDRTANAMFDSGAFVQL